MRRALTRIAGWFAVPPPSPVALAVFRVWLGALVVVDAATRLPTAGLFLSENGLLPAALQPELRPSLFNLFGGAEWWAVALLVGYGLCGLCLVVGFRARTAAIAGWFLILSLHHRNPFVTDGGDFLLRLALLWAAFLPIGAAFSADRMRRAPGLNRLPTGAWAVFCIQTALVYLVTAGHKLIEGQWIGGDALARALGLLHWTKPPAAALGAHVEWLPALSVLIVAVQIVAPLALLTRLFALRMAAVAALAGMQVSFFFLFQLGLFPWAGLAFLIPFLPLGSGSGAWEVRREWRSLVCVSVAVVTFSYAVLSLVFPARDDAVERTLRLAGLNQRWPMFASPPDESKRVAVVAGGVDLIAQSWSGDGALGGKPFAHALYENARWSAFLTSLAERGFRGGGESQQLVARRLGEHFASLHPQLASQGWRVVEFRKFFFEGDENDGTADIEAEIARGGGPGR